MTVAMLVLASAFVRAADMTDAQLYAEARKGIADKAKPVFLKCVYLRKGEFEKFKQVLSKEARAFVEKLLATDKDYLVKLQNIEQMQPFDEKSTEFEVRSHKAIDEESAVFGDGERLKKSIEGVILNTPNQNVGRAPAFVVKEGAYWRLAFLDGMPKTTVWDNVRKQAEPITGANAG